MTKGEIIFLVITLCWLFIGYLGVPEKDRGNYELVLFIFFAPFIPILAMVCGLF